jgi:hypothetical protein
MSGTPEIAQVEQEHSIQCRMLGNDTDGCACQSLNTMPMVEAMDLLDRFWNASLSRWAEDWTAFGIGCECGNCKTCGMRNVLSWTMAVLSNPSLADLAERKAADRSIRPGSSQSGEAS